MSQHDPTEPLRQWAEHAATVLAEGGQRLRTIAEQLAASLPVAPETTITVDPDDLQRNPGSAYDEAKDRLRQAIDQSLLPPEPTRRCCGHEPFEVCNACLGITDTPPLDPTGQCSCHLGIKQVCDVCQYGPTPEPTEDTEWAGEHVWSAAMNTPATDPLWSVRVHPDDDPEDPHARRAVKLDTDDLPWFMPDHSWSFDDEEIPAWKRQDLTDVARVLGHDVAEYHVDDEWRELEDRAERAEATLARIREVVNMQVTPGPGEVLRAIEAILAEDEGVN